MDGKPILAISRFTKYQAINHFNGNPFVLPKIPCGIYEYTAMFADNPTELLFRRVPRAAKNKGKFGLFADDPDAGIILIGLYNPKTEQIEREHRDLYAEYWEAWLGSKLITRRCAWCGREMPFYTDRMTHDSDNCDQEPEKYLDSSEP